MYAFNYQRSGAAPASQYDPQNPGHFDEVNDCMAKVMAVKTKTL
jgi:hypothetical protein